MGERSGIAATVVALAVAAVWLATKASAFVAIVVALAVLGLVVILLFRSALFELGRRRLSLETGSDVRDDGRFGTPRRLFYAGLLSVCWLQLRIAGLTISDMVFLLSLVLVVVEMTSSARWAPAALPRDIAWGAYLFTLGGAVSTFHSPDPAGSLATIAKFAYLVVVWFWLGAMCLRTYTHVWRAIAFWVASAAICGFYAVAQKYAHLPAPNASFGRYAGLADHVNDLGSLSACAIVPAIGLSLRDWRWLIAVAGIGGGLALSGSVGGGVASLGALAVGLVARELTRPVVGAAVAFGLFLVLLGPVLGATSPLERAQQVASSGSQLNTVNGRLEGYSVAWARIKADPIVGTGLDNASEDVTLPSTGSPELVHNLFIGQWRDAGILGLLGILLILYGLARVGWQTVILARDRLLPIVLLAGFVAFVIDEMSEPGLDKRYALVAPMLIVAAYTICRRSDAVRVPVSGGKDGSPVAPLDAVAIAGG